MKRLLTIEGMHCMRCSAKVEKTLTEMGLTAHVDLDAKTCVVEGDAPEADIRAAIADKGFEVVKVEALA